MDYVPIFVANGFYKNRTDFKRTHVVYNTFTKFPKVDRYINVGRLVRQRAQLLVEMPYVRHTRRRHVEVPLTYDKETLDLVLTKRWHVYEERPLRDVGEMCAVARRVVNSDPSRLEMVKELWQIHPKLIVFYNFNYELEALRTLKEYCGSGMEISSLSRDTDGLVSSGSMAAVESSWSSIPDSSSSRLESDRKKLKEYSQISIPSNSSRSSALESKLVVPTAANHGPNGILLETSQPSGSRVTGIGSAGTSTPTSQLTATNTSNVGRDLEWASTDGSNAATEMRTGSSLSTKLTGATNRSFGKTICCLEEKIHSNDISTSSSKPGTAGRGNSSCSDQTATTGCPVDFGTTVSIAEWNGHKHEPIPNSDRWLYLVQYIAGAEAWECIETDATVFYSRNYSWKVWEQAQGRIDRLNTPFNELWYYNFTSDSWIDRAIERSLKAKGTFNESAFAGMFKG